LPWWLNLLRELVVGSVVFGDEEEITPGPQRLFLMCSYKSKLLVRSGVC